MFCANQGGIDIDRDIAVVERVLDAFFDEESEVDVTDDRYSEFQVVVLPTFRAYIEPDHDIKSEPDIINIIRMLNRVFGIPISESTLPSRNNSIVELIYTLIDPPDILFGIDVPDDSVWQAHHTFLQITTPEGYVIATGAGPDSPFGVIGPIFSTFGGGTAIEPVPGPNFRDFGADPIFAQVVGYVDLSASEIRSRIQAYSQEVNSSLIPYSTLDQNSNSYAFQSTIIFGISRPDAILWAPASQSLLFCGAQLCGTSIP